MIFLTLFAQTEPAPAALASWLSVAFYLAALIAAIGVAWHYLTGKAGQQEITPQPLSVEHAPQYVTRAEHDELKGQVDSIREKIDVKFTELDKKRSVSIAGLHDDLDRKVGNLREEIHTENQGLHNRITEVIEKVGELKGRLAR